MQAQTLVAVATGAIAMLVLDAQLGNVIKDDFAKAVQLPWMRFSILFGAVYGANGGKMVPSLLALALYFVFSQNKGGLSSLIASQAPTSLVHQTKGRLARVMEALKRPPEEESSGEAP